MNLSSILGAVLQGAMQPPRRAPRRRVSAIPGLGGRSGQAQLARALAGLATVAVEALSRPRAEAPSPPPPSRPLPDLRPSAPATPGAPQGSVPRTGASPWSPRPATPEASAEAATSEASAETAEALLMVRVMIAAARADGAIDATERGAIAAQLDAAGLGTAERDFVLADFDKPLSAAAIAKEVRDPMQAAQLYAGAFAAMGEVSAAERSWLDGLAKALKLDRAAAAAIEARLGG